jgi:hypothetical protein
VSSLDGVLCSSFELNIHTTVPGRVSAVVISDMSQHMYQGVGFLANCGPHEQAEPVFNATPKARAVLVQHNAERQPDRQMRNIGAVSTSAGSMNSHAQGTDEDDQKIQQYDDEVDAASGSRPASGSATRVTTVTTTGTVTTGSSSSPSSSSTPTSTFIRYQSDVKQRHTTVALGDPLNLASPGDLGARHAERQRVLQQQEEEQRQRTRRVVGWTVMAGLGVAGLYVANHTYPQLALHDRVDSVYITITSTLPSHVNRLLCHAMERAVTLYNALSVLLASYIKPLTAALRHTTTEPSHQKDTFRNTSKTSKNTI